MANECECNDRNVAGSIYLIFDANANVSKSFFVQSTLGKDYNSGVDAGRRSLFSFCYIHIAPFT